MARPEYLGECMSADGCPPRSIRQVAACWLLFVLMQAALGAHLSVLRRHLLMLMVQSGPSILQEARRR